jgi:uncharacterized protein YdaU (DUF1376 family)
MYQDFTKASDLRGVLDKKIQAENAFYNLPVDIRREFDHDIDKFMKNGGEYINKRIAKEQEELRKIVEGIKADKLSEAEKEIEKSKEVEKNEHQKELEKAAKTKEVKKEDSPKAGDAQ